MSFLRIFTILVLYFLLTLTGSLALIYSTGSECSPLLCPGPPPIRPSFGTYLSPLVPANCLSHVIPIDACCVGGSVLVNSEPRNIFIDYANCDVYLNTEDFAVSPTVAFPEAIEVRVLIKCADNLALRRHPITRKEPVYDISTYINEEKLPIVNTIQLSGVTN